MPVTVERQCAPGSPAVLWKLLHVHRPVLGLAVFAAVPSSVVVGVAVVAAAAEVKIAGMTVVGLFRVFAEILKRHIVLLGNPSFSPC